MKKICPSRGRLEPPVVFGMRISAAEIHLAVETGQLDALKTLLDSGADPNAVYRGATPLGKSTQAVRRSMVTALLDAGADPNIRSRGLNDRVETPLYTACRFVFFKTNFNLSLIYSLIVVSG